MMSSVTITDIASEPAHPSRFEKNKNTSVRYPRPSVAKRRSSRTGVQGAPWNRAQTT
jgi:hypothetical protein